MAAARRRLFTVRDFQEKDSAAVQEMMKALVKVRGLKTRFVLVGGAYDAYLGPYLRSVMRDRDTVMRVAEDEGRIVGYVLGARSSEPRFAEHTKVAELVDMYVVESHRGIGVARALLDALEEWAKARGLTALTVNAFPQLTEELEALRSLGFLDYRVKLLRPLEK